MDTIWATCDSLTAYEGHKKYLLLLTVVQEVQKIEPKDKNKRMPYTMPISFDVLLPSGISVKHKEFFDILDLKKEIENKQKSIKEFYTKNNK